MSVDSVKVTYPAYQPEEGGAVPTSTLQFMIVEVSVRSARDLNARWHSLLPRTDLGNLLCGRTSAAYAAVYEGRAFAVGIWSQPIVRQLCDGETVELRRMAICDQAPKNTASRMLSIMRKMIRQKYPQLRKAISYQAVDVHVGTIYRAAGWRPVGTVCQARPQRLPGSKQRATGPLQTTSRKQRWEIAL
jgi:hypothetical protein